MKCAAGELRAVVSASEILTPPGYFLVSISARTLKPVRDQYKQAGIRRLVSEVDARQRRPGSSLYLVANSDGEGLAGNVASLEPGVLESEGCVRTAYRRLGDAASAKHNAPVRVVRLPNGVRLLVGRDLDER
jgi:hypothetical protein